MKLIVNCETGEVIERELNKEEKDQQKIDQIAFDLEQKAKEAEAEAKAAKKAALLERLGITQEEANLLLG